MKRSILIILSALLILLTGCHSEPPAIEESFTSVVTVSDGSFDCTAQIDRTPDAVTVTMTAPLTVAGIRYTCTKAELRTSCDELICITDTDRLPPSAAPAVLCAVLGGLSDAVYESSDDSGDHYRLHMSEGDAVITCRKGVILSVKADSSPCTFTFSQ